MFEKIRNMFKKKKDIIHKETNNEIKKLDKKNNPKRYNGEPLYP